MNRYTIKRGAVALGALATLAASPKAYAQSQDALLDKLVTKGVLTQSEAQELREEADDSFRKSYQAKSGMPDWVTSLRFNGDFRARYDGIYTDGKTIDRHRYRYRLRFGVTALMTDNFEVGFRLGSGDATQGSGFIDPISLNQTLENNGAKKGIYIDLVYAKWTPLNTADWSFGLTVGKMENPFVFSDLIFDTDYTLEGASTQLKYTLNDKQSFKLISGGFILDEIGNSSADPYMLAAQARWDAIWDDKQRWQSSVGIAALTIVHDEGLTNGAVPNISIGNDRSGVIPTNPLLEGMNPIVADASLTYTADSFPMFSGKFPIKVGGEFIHNPAAGSDNDAYSFGVLLGKSGKRKTWDIGYRWKELQANAWYEELVDSDSGAFYTAAYPNSGAGSGYRPGTNIRGHVVRANYSPYDSLTLGFTFYMLEAIKESPALSGSWVNRLQVDAVWKF